MNLKSFIIPKVLQNTDENQEFGNADFNTIDLVYLDSFDEIAAYEKTSVERKSSPTD